MTPTKWLQSARAARKVLVSLIGEYHPVYRHTSRMSITAARAEAACQVVRDQIKAASTSDPLARFEQALDEGNEGDAYMVLSDTWFGVPESTDCWMVIGFSECVSLLEDPPEYDGPEDEV